MEVQKGGATGPGSYGQQVTILGLEPGSDMSGPGSALPVAAIWGGLGRRERPGWTGTRNESSRSQKLVLHQQNYHQGKRYREGGARGATGKPVLERSRSWRCSRLGPDNSLLRGAVLASWAATREMPAAPSALCCDKMSPTMVKCRLEVKNCS